MSLITLGCFVLSQTGCATIVSGRNQNIPVVSIPSGAIVTVEGQKQISPATFILDRKRAVYQIRVEKEGFEPVEVTLKKGVNGWVWGNILFGIIGGAIGLTIDLSTGSASKFIPNDVEVNLVNKQLGAGHLKDKDILFVKLIEKK